MNWLKTVLNKVKLIKMTKIPNGADGISIVFHITKLKLTDPYKNIGFVWINVSKGNIPYGKYGIFILTRKSLIPFGIGFYKPKN